MLRVSTLVLVLLGIVAFFVTLRVLNVDRFPAGLATLTLFFNPVVFVLAYSFMTDVPFLSVMNMAILCYVLWVQRRRPIFLGLGSLFAIASFLIRQIGAAVALVPITHLLLSRVAVGERRKPSRSELVFLFVPFAGMALTQWWIRDVQAEHIPGCNMAFRTANLRAIGGFDPQFRTAGDDVDVCWRLQERGWTLGFNPAAVVWHHRRASLRAYWRQQVGYGRAEALLERKWPGKYSRRARST
jgi:hypothetical protein